MEKLDRLVTGHLIERLFKPERPADILSSLSARRAQEAESVSSRLMALQQEVADAEEKLSRLYRLVEDGLADLDDVLKGRLAGLKADRDRARAALERAKEQLRPQIHIDPALIERFGRVMRENLSTGSVPFRKPTCSRSSQALRSMTTKSGSGEARNCWRRPFLLTKLASHGVRR